MPATEHNSPELIPHDRLRVLVSRIFAAAGSLELEAKTVADHLVDSNLVGHDSHGLIRVAAYVDWISREMLFPNREPKVVLDDGALAVLDAQLGFGQMLGVHAMDLAIEKSSQHGVGIVGLRNAGHVGRGGHWAEIAVRAGKIAICLINTSGFGILAAPHGGTDRRISANPFVVGIPTNGDNDFILDISTSAIAEGKIRVARNRGERVPPNCLLDGAGDPTDDPERFYADPPGAILPFGGHKGYGLALAVDILAGALTGGGCSKRGRPQLEQAMLAIVVDPDRFGEGSLFAEEIESFLAFVKASPTADPHAEILVPGEIEARTRDSRRREGVPVDANTWNQLLGACEKVGIDRHSAEDIVRA